MAFGTYVFDYREGGEWVDFTTLHLSLKDLNIMFNDVFFNLRRGFSSRSLTPMDCSQFPLYMFIILNISMNHARGKPGSRE